MKAYIPLIEIRPSDGDVKPGGHFANFLSVGMSLAGGPLMSGISYSHYLRQVWNFILILKPGFVKDDGTETQFLSSCKKKIYLG